MIAHTKRGAALLATLALGAAAVAGCGSSGSKSSTSSSTATGSASAPPPAKVAVDPAAAKLVPAAIKQKGTLIVATDPTYAPDEFIAKDGKTIVGFDPELSVALGQKLGLKTRVVNSTFDAIIPGLAAKKYDLGISSHNDTKERQKTVDFVDYYTAGSSFYTKAQGGPTINSLADLCGHKVAVEKGTTQADDALAQDKKCKAAGKAGVTALVLPDQNGANLALSSGRAEVGMADTPVAAYIAEQSNGQFKVVGPQYATAPHGIAIPKGNGMAQPVLVALKSLMADGTYPAILKKWGVSEIATSHPTINGATT
ncbi:MAG: extracellular solute-binding protein family 3 [Conexibacter sp.]|nr:extracellular solute-binding protein family 3 [Conexibacter sp.]